MKILLGAATGLWALCGLAGTGVTAEIFSEQERAIIQSFGPWPLSLNADPSNNMSDNNAAIKLGKALFFDKRLSKNNDLSCADCHDPNNSFADGQALNSDHGDAIRNTPSLFNLRWSSWFGWGGEADSLWSQSIRPMLSPEEMALTGEKLRNLLDEDRLLASQIQQVSGVSIAAETDEVLFVLIGKLLAAYQETLVSEPTAFDRFRLAQETADLSSSKGFSNSAKRGLKIFIGDGRCFLCHFGPMLSNGEFGDIGISQFISKGKIDRGRYAGIKILKSSPFNRLGKYSDNPEKVEKTRTEHVTLQHKNWGEFKIPSLRNVSKTGPYMHNGSLATLADVVDFYSNLNEERLHTQGEAILKPLSLSDTEKEDLLSFLRTL